MKNSRHLSPIDLQNLLPGWENVAVRLLTELVRIPSPSGQEAEAVSYLVQWMTDHGFNAFIDPAGNAVGTMGSGPKTVLFLGHIDTVPGWIPVQMDEHHRLTGRGSVDAKGPLAACAVVCALMGPREGWRMMVVGAVEEEAPSSRGARYLTKTLSPPDFCLIAEPSGVNGITLGYRGRLGLNLVISKPIEHGGTPSLNAVETLVALWREIQEKVESLNHELRTHKVQSTGTRINLFHQISCRLMDVRTDSNGLHQTARMSIDFRLPPSSSPHALLNELQPLIKKINAHFEVTGMEPAFVSDKKSPLVRALSSAIYSAGMKPRFLLKTGTSDMNVVGPVWACPIVAYGPGDSRLDHTPDEYISLEDYLMSIRILKNMLRELMDPDHR